MLNVAIIGSGFIGSAHGEAYKALPQYSLKAIVDCNEEVGRKMADTYSAQWYATMDDLLAQEEIHVIDICLPTFLHEKFVLEALSKGKHVVCEKPITLEMDSMDRMIAAAETAGTKFMVAQVIRFWPEYEKIKELYQTEAFGKLNMVYANRLSQHPAWTNWHRDPLKSGGGLYDLHVHDIDLVVSMFGEVDTVYAVGTASETNCWNFISTSLIFKNGVKAVVEGVFDITPGYPFTMTYRVLGEKMTAEYQMKAGENLEDIAGAQRYLKLYEVDKAPAKLDMDEFDAYAAELAYFASCVEENKPVDKCSPQSSKYVLDVVLSIKKSLETNQLIQL